ncbi:S1 family peptidase [Nonomuraea polychroma]|uniref:S1 family peptidase n=1 Tax=Nonomuraea polychroma TaxID=46176 RepID=UPI003D8F4CEA
MTATAAVSATPEDEPVKDKGTEDGLAKDAESYAKDYGVSHEEAKARLAAQQVFGQIVEKLAEAHPDRFAGSAINHEGAFGLTVYLTGDRIPDTAAEIAADNPSVTIKAGAPRSLTEAEKTIESTGDALDSNAAVQGVYYDAKAQEFVLDMAGAPVGAQSAEDAEAALRTSLSDTLPQEIRSARIELAPTAAGDGRRGGLHMSTCTSGFSVRNSSGVQGILTAGHCGNTQSYRYYSSSTWYSTTYRAQARTSTADVQWHTATGNTASPTFHASSTSSTRTLTGRVLRTSQSGDYVCHRGKTTGYSCGTVASISYRPTWDNACPGTTCSATWIRVTGSSLACYPGDSGGPWFNASSAYGIYKGQSSSGTGQGQCRFAVYMAINYISSINVSLMYG